MTEYRAEDQSGHAIHFLKRLPRAQGEAAQLALRLYHDPELLRNSLFGIRIPDGFDRVALSLCEGDKGPYIVASRTGKFVTCLGEEMSIRGLHLIPYTQLLAYLDKTRVNRERLAHAEELVGESGDFCRLIDFMRNRAEDLSREEFLALAALQPALQQKFFTALFGYMTHTRDLSRHLHQQKKIGKKEEDNLKRYYRYFFTAAHLAALSGMNNVRGLESTLEYLRERNPKFSFVSALSTMLRSGRPYMAMRLAWLIGRIGPSLLPDCRRLLVKPTIPESWLLGLLGALVIGNRHRKTNQQAQKAVTAAFRNPEAHSRDVLRWMVENTKDDLELPSLVMDALVISDEMFEESIDFAKEVTHIYTEPIHLAQPFDWKSHEEIPRDIAFAVAASSTESFRHHPYMVTHMVLLTPWLARCNAEDLYLPQSFLDAIHIPWNTDIAMALLEDERERLGTPRPVKVEKTPGRNDPCPCGSHEKYKKCCGAAEHADAQK